MYSGRHVGDRALEKRRGQMDDDEGCPGFLARMAESGLPSLIYLDLNLTVDNRKHKWKHGYMSAENEMVYIF
jgi:hypothetical protein